MGQRLPPELHIDPWQITSENGLHNASGEAIEKDLLRRSAVRCVLAKFQSDAIVKALSGGA